MMTDATETTETTETPATDPQVESGSGTEAPVSPVPDSSHPDEITAWDFIDKKDDDVEPEPTDAEPESTDTESADAKQSPETQPDRSQADQEADEFKLKDRSRQRFVELHDRARVADEWERVVFDTGASAEQLQAALSYLKLMNANDPSSLGKVYEVLTAEMAEVAKKLGRDAPGVDPIAGHADLKEAVESGEIALQHAKEIAAARAEKQFIAQRDTEQVQTAQQAQQAKDAAIQSLNDIGARLQSQDPQFSAKIAQLVPKIAEIRSNYHPSQWAQQFMTEYLSATVASTVAPAPAPTVARPRAGHVPLRPTGSIADMVSSAKTDMEAFEIGIRSAGH